MTNIIQFYKNSQSFSLASKFNFSKKKNQDLNLKALPLPG